MLMDGGELNSINNKKMYSFFKRSLNTIEGNSAEANENLINTFGSL